MKRMIMICIALICAIWIFQACQNAQENNPNNSLKTGALVNKTISANAESFGELHNAILAYHYKNSTPYDQVGYLVNNGELLIDYSYVEQIISNTKQYFIDSLHSTENLDSAINDIVTQFEVAGMVKFVNGKKYLASMIDYLPTLYFNSNPHFNGHEYIDPIITAYKNRDPEKAEELIAALSALNTAQMPEVEAFISVLNHSDEFWNDYYGNNVSAKEGGPWRDLCDAGGGALGSFLTGNPFLGAALGTVGGSCLYDIAVAIVNELQKEEKLPMRQYFPKGSNGNAEWYCGAPPRSCSPVDIVVTPNNPQQFKKSSSADEIKKNQIMALLNAIDNGTCQEFFQNVNNFNEAVSYVSFSQLYDLRKGIVTMKYFSNAENTYTFYTVNTLNAEIFPKYSF